jgi:hypothetical protein
MEHLFITLCGIAFLTSFKIPEAGSKHLEETFFGLEYSGWMKLSISLAGLVFVFVAFELLQQTINLLFG